MLQFANSLSIGWSNAETVTKRVKNRADWRRLPEKSLIGQAQVASALGGRNSNGRISPGDRVTLGDADFRKSPMKMIYRKLPKTASLSVTCHPLFVCPNRISGRSMNVSYTHTMQRAANAIQITTITTPATRLTGFPFLKVSWALHSAVG